MGRPSVQKERKEQVLDAFVTVVARFGVEGATLERISEASGLKRPLIRHHLGNRDEMIHALAAYVVEQQIAAIEELKLASIDYPGLQTFVDILFSENQDGRTSDNRFNSAYQALIAVVEHYPDLRQPLLSVMVQFYELASEVVRLEAPEAAPTEITIVAHGIIDLYLATDSLAPLNPPESWAPSSYQGALRLVQSLSRT